VFFSQGWGKTGDGVREKKKQNLFGVKGWGEGGGTGKIPIRPGEKKGKKKEEELVVSQRGFWLRLQIRKKNRKEVKNKEWEEGGQEGTGGSGGKRTEKMG